MTFHLPPARELMDLSRTDLCSEGSPCSECRWMDEIEGTYPPAPVRTFPVYRGTPVTIVRTLADDLVEVLHEMVLKTVSIFDLSEREVF